MPVLSTLGAAIANVYGFTSGLIKDQYFNLVSLLLPGNGTDGKQNRTFLDSSGQNGGAGWTITPNGNTTQGTFSPFSQTGWGAYFDGTDDYLSVADTAALDFGSGNFTIETWIYMTGGSGATRMIFGKWASNVGIELYVSTANKLEVYINAGVGATSTGTLALNQWHHVALVRSGTGSNQTKLYINGSEDGSGTAGSSVDNAAALNIGTSNAGSNDFTGYMSNYRVVKGVAVYTGNFTVPTSPLAATQSAGTNISAITGSETSLLTCQSNRFKDSSSTPLTVTPNGSPSVTPFSPFAPTQSYSAAAVGGSGYFDGTGDYLTGPTNTATAFNLTGDFTIECWTYFNSVSTAYAGILNWSDSSGWNGFHLFNNAGTLGFEFLTGSGAAGQVSGGAVTTGQWYFLQIVRSGSAITFYKNGTSVATTTYASSQTSSSSFIKVGVDRTAAISTTGYISGIRIVNGTALSSSVPTSPPTAITNTSLLLNFTNAGVVDATAKNVLETVGNAQISNGAGGGKWGGGSMRFPQSGTNDYLYKPYDVLLNRLNGNFTMECWIYPTAAGTQMIFAGSLSSGGSDNWIWEITSASKLSFTFSIGGSSVTATSTASISQNTWTYVAVVRNGGTLTQYINGSVDGTSSPTAGAYRNASFGFAIGRGGDYNASYYTGYIDDFRITIGQARTITTPTAPFPVQ